MGWPFAKVGQVFSSVKAATIGKIGAITTAGGAIAYSTKSKISEHKKQREKEEESA